MSSDNVSFPQVLATSVQDMKSSLSMLLSSLETISEQSKELDENQRQACSILHYEAARINSELFQLQLLHKLSKNDLVPQIDEYYLIDTLQEQLANCDSLLEVRGVEVDLQCDEDFSWYFDSELISAVVYKNLVNCARYSKGRVQLLAEESDGQLLISISDDGNGYPPFMLEQAELKQLPEQFNSTHLDHFCNRRIAELHTKQNECGSLSIANGGAYGGGLFQLRLP
ncbi:sensor histidine kinase [Pseudoteredinibacter isoporae]|uniref:histidine kinase n=1 Tax=Pseudoteredinibacter isoporae TaxID=570281 RepID=A0A7X0JWN3_9GAMM|nr:HAMP domain-containing histidine kinase [Pseudoteredinibacter isoporae]MBB6523567.1 signal transduction histidine kinase [Pseudoteredinibacter isoporae]NHO89075.1 HAMP domain-containing histidine kinase [Pseudoteredinibacter isoporae]NIB22314.1 HAMP domain-containing histidine kinase [Pseudoteredinibacter isoporae]